MSDPLRVNRGYRVTPADRGERCVNQDGSEPLRVNDVYRVPPIDYLALLDEKINVQRDNRDAYVNTNCSSSGSDSVTRRAINDITPDEVLSGSSLLSEIQRLFRAETLGSLPRAEAEARWQAKLPPAPRPPDTRPADFLSRYPWPASLPGLGPRAVSAYQPCADCQEESQAWGADIVSIWITAEEFSKETGRLEQVRRRVKVPMPYRLGGTWVVFGPKALCLDHARKRAKG